MQAREGTFFESRPSHSQPQLRGTPQHRHCAPRTGSTSEPRHSCHPMHRPLGRFTVRSSALRRTNPGGGCTATRGSVVSSVHEGQGEAATLRRASTVTNRPTASPDDFGGAVPRRRGHKAKPDPRPTRRKTRSPAGAGRSYTPLSPQRGANYWPFHVKRPPAGRLAPLGAAGQAFPVLHHPRRCRSMIRAPAKLKKGTDPDRGG